MAAKLTLDRFELLWFCEGFVGKSHLRWDGYEKMVNDVFPQLNENERECIYTYVRRDLSWHFDGKYADETPHEYFKQMLARYNPANQYKVTLKKGCKKEIVDAYKWNDKYYVGWSNYCADEYITNIEHKPYRKCNNKFCKSNGVCVRYNDNIDINEQYINGNSSYACDKCDLIITNIENNNN